MDEVDWSKMCCIRLIAAHFAVPSTNYLHDVLILQMSMVLMVIGWNLGVDPIPTDLTSELAT